MTTEIGYIKFHSVNGSVLEVKHKDWSTIYKIAGGAYRVIASTSGRQTMHKGTPADIVIVKGFDIATPTLFEKTSEGKVFPTVEIEQVSSMGGPKAEVVIRTKLTNVVITNFNLSAVESSGGTLPVETLALTYSEIQVEFFEFGPDGKPAGKSMMGWNVAAGS